MRAQVVELENHDSKSIVTDRENNAMRLQQRAEE